MGIIAWTVLGLVAGVITQKLLGRRTKHGIIVTILIGITGALLGGWAATAFFDVDTTGRFFDLPTWIIAIIGSALLLLGYHAITGSSRRHWPLTRARR
ncbi:GlsB/YeaQ/YmgE family stress response membrane protein [Amycolatopsis anabasis]|uniref:GlsB/YeaQ/YmgE family stress response membrane protein n=1 Tax=Amycolatopsis anabasis TaxID=1840409 RepID=UPI00131BD629|nr:GlsB/YeaQ/YmgE family stress response membrane protein [Amycolatopsis anabasis]